MSPGSANHSRLLTPPGTGAIAVIRITGPRAGRIVGRFFQPVNHPGQGSTAEQLDSLLAGRRLRYGYLVDANEVIDDVIVARVSAGEVAAYDISAHGGIRVAQRILALFEREGAPLRDEGEALAPIWPQKNLIEQEALEALRTAKTSRCVCFLAWQRRHLASRLQALTSCGDSATAEQGLQAMFDRYRSARWLIDGATLVIVGPPNSGKSTLFNRLMGRSAAIVSDKAGTTRDWVAEPIELGGVPITLVDTAGRHDTADTLEHDAIARGASIGRRADLRILLFDGSEPLPLAMYDTTALLDLKAPDILVVNKADLKAAWRVEELSVGVSGGLAAPLAISARTGEGIAALEQRVLGTLGLDNGPDEAPAIFTARQYELAGRMLTGCRESGSAVFAHALDRLVGIFSDAEGNIARHGA